MATKPKPEELVAVKMLNTTKGVNDGDIYAKQFVKDETYNLGPSLAAEFIKHGQAEALSAEKPESAENDGTPPVPAEFDVDGATKDELIAFAGDNEITIDKKATKPVILEAIKAALGGEKGDDGDANGESDNPDGDTGEESETTDETQEGGDA